MLKTLKGKRTFIVAAGVAVVGALQTLDYTEVVNEQNAGVVLIVLGAVGAILRLYTTTPPGKSE